MYKIVLISAFILIWSISSCDISHTNEGLLNEFVIKLTEEPNCPSIGFKISSNDNSFKEILRNPNNYKIEIKGAFFDDPLFSMIDPVIKPYKNDTIVIVSRSCYFKDKNQHELDSIASITLKVLSVTILEGNKKWVFTK